MAKSRNEMYANIAANLLARASAITFGVSLFVSDGAEFRYGAGYLLFLAMANRLDAMYEQRAAEDKSDAR